MTPEPLAFIGTADLAGLLRGKSIPLAGLDEAAICARYAAIY